MHRLTGYADRWSAKQGGALRFMVSSEVGRDYRLRFVRHLCGDPNPDGPGYCEVALPTLLDGIRAGQDQKAHLGSFARATLALGPAHGLRLSATIWPTTPRKGEQGVLSVAIGDWKFSLGIGPCGGAMAEGTGPRGEVVQVEIAHRLLQRRWYDIVAELTPGGTMMVSQSPHAPLGDNGEASGAAAPAPTGPASVFIAALPSKDEAPARGYYNGKIERPAIHVAGTPIAQWDFSLGIPTQTAQDIGPQRAHATLVNLPTRAMTGSNWTGAVHDWKTAPEQYGAIHFHGDDQGPLGWDESFALDIPADWTSGFYAAHISNDAGEDFIP